jgi:hypothetical protein
MSKKGKKAGQSGGVNISGTVGTVGDIAGRDQFTLAQSGDQITLALSPVLDAIKAAPPQVKPEAEAKLTELKHEVAVRRDDGVMAKLLNELIGLVPAAASAVGSAFATPLLGALVGPATKAVLEKLRGK